MQRSTIWHLTLSYWQHAIDNNVKPINKSYHFLEDPYPGYYTPRGYKFQKPPSRADFDSLVQLSPCMQIQDYLPVIAANDWPIIETGYKAASVDLLDDQKRVVGKLEVRRQDVFQNEGYQLPDIDCDMVNRIINRLPKGKRDKARVLILHRVNFIRERILCEVEGWEANQENVAYVIRQLLHSEGLLKTKPRQPIN